MSSPSCTGGGVVLKRELKHKQEEEERKQKKEVKANQAANKTTSQEQKSAATFGNRLKYLAALKEEGKNPYTHYHATIGEHLEERTVSLAGRIMIKRSSSSKLFFYDLNGGGPKVQIMTDTRKSGMKEAQFSKFHSHVKRGDIVGITGFPCLVHYKRELSIFPTSFTVLSHCLHVVFCFAEIEAWLPGCTRNPETYVLRDQVHQVFKTRSKIITYVRSFIENLDFLEVEKPVMNMIAGGAAARPFVTHHNELNMRLYMRIAAEHFLKELVGVELTECMRLENSWNEGIDLTHNPEFTTCKFYMAFNFVLFKIGLVKQLTGGNKIKYHANGLDIDPIEIDFTPPFRRIDMIDELGKMANLNIQKDLSSDEANKYLVAACEMFEVMPCSSNDILPLVQWHRSKPGFTERFGLFINKHELCDAYTELNDPLDRQSGDDEAMALDETFCTAFKYGLPPTGGWGMGFDRLAMLLTDSQNIKEVLLFPAMKPQDEPPAKGIITILT
ncbi:hypothetical protein K2173_017539 [Erythroxylum novogranatense]|uniref:Lysyl-tRNA synthetase n=1 Tax=Erythroxylum novogranatense TaxID=1862640 RepID=A0AAV8TMN4_9ROSI|nr:hypothetical protein K2173_017539 [Erythroxylum novogranatense]